MAFIDIETYNAACKKSDISVDKIFLMEAIFRVYEMWFRDQDAGVKVIFHAYFGLALLDMGIDDLFRAERYRKAIAAYFQPRALKKIATKGRDILWTMPDNPVEKAGPSRVRIRVSQGKSLEFRATRTEAEGELKWGHVVEAFEVTHDTRFIDTKVDTEMRWKAQRQAFQVMNDHRRQKC